MKKKIKKKVSVREFRRQKIVKEEIEIKKLIERGKNKRKLEKGVKRRNFDM